MKDRQFLPDHEALTDTVLDLVATTVDVRRDQIRPDTPLFSSVERFDSFALLELVIRLERTFDLSIPDDDLDPEDFASAEAIASYLFARLQPGGVRE